MPLSAARSGGLLPLTGRTKYEPDLWHLDGARHNPFKFGRLTLETAELFASVSRRLSPTAGVLTERLDVFPKFRTESIEAALSALGCCVNDSWGVAPG